jgi:hypothetical protein
MRFSAMFCASVLALAVAVFALTAEGVFAATPVKSDAGVTKFDKPIEIVISENVRDPDQYIDEFIARAKIPAEQSLLQTIKTFEHDTKVKWLLGLSKLGMPGAICITVVTIVVVYVIVGYEIYRIGAEERRRAIYERQEQERRTRECR